MNDAPASKSSRSAFAGRTVDPQHALQYVGQIEEMVNSWTTDVAMARHLARSACRAAESLGG